MEASSSLWPMASGRRRRHLSGGQSAVERPTRRGIGAAMHWLSCHLGQHLRAREFSGARRRTGCFHSPCSAGSKSKQADHQLLLHTSTRGSAIAYSAIRHQSGTVGFILLALRQLVCRPCPPNRKGGWIPSHLHSLECGLFIDLPCNLNGGV